VLLGTASILNIVIAGVQLVCFCHHVGFDDSVLLCESCCCLVDKDVCDL
jgi:hypothetical protein